MREPLCGRPAPTRSRHRRPPALSPRQFQRHRGSIDLRRAARRIRRRDRAVAGLSLGHYACCRASPLTMEDVLARDRHHLSRKPTSLSMTGGQIKDVLEDVCDNLFNADPYYQQGGDMVRVGGLAYTCTPAEAVGRTDFRTEARQRPHARGRQELQGGRMGLRQRTERRAGMGCVRKASALAARRRTGSAPASRLRGVDDNPGIAGQG